MIHSLFPKDPIQVPYSQVMSSDVQGFANPQGYKGRGKEGKGTGQDFLTLKKPQPLSRVGVFVRVS